MKSESAENVNARPVEFGGMTPSPDIKNKGVPPNQRGGELWQ